MRFKLTFAPTADQSFPSLPRWARQRFDRAFDQLEREARRARVDFDVHQLYGYTNIWTLRIPPCRGVYAIDGIEVVMVIFGHRDTVYQDLHRLLPPRRQAVSKAALARRR
jgi:mRNA-degrading endonuclease RelE of RelBE toxin-antitoxin system